MPKPSCDSANREHLAASTQHIAAASRFFRWTAVCYVLGATCYVLGGGCATPPYAIRGTPLPDESASAHQIEQAISAVQGREFAQEGARPMDPSARFGGVGIQQLIDRLSRVTERPALSYRAYLYEDADPNAAALADGRIYLSTGMLDYLHDRGSRADELASVISHELAHTVTQHIVKRYRLLQRQQLLIALVAAGTTAATREASAGAQQAGRLALDAASLLRDIHNSGYSQEQELEADQLGIRYLMRAGFDPQAALELLEDFSRFDNPWPFLRTHPYADVRREYLQRYLTDIGARRPSAQPTPGPSRVVPRLRAETVDRHAIEARRRRLREAQQLYPVGSVSWQNLQRQIEAIEQGTR